MSTPTPQFGGEFAEEELNFNRLSHRLSHHRKNSSENIKLTNSIISHNLDEDQKEAAGGKGRLQPQSSNRNSTRRQS